MILNATDEINFSVSIIKIADRYAENGQHDIAKILVAVAQMLLSQLSPAASEPAPWHKSTGFYSVPG